MRKPDITLKPGAKRGNIISSPSFSWGIPGEYKSDPKKRKKNKLARKARRKNR